MPATPIVFLLSVFPFLITAENCSTAFCTHNSTTIPIHFPFKLQTNKHEKCGYPGFNVHCSSPGGTVLKLAGSGEFLVREISYAKQQIRLNDPGHCLPGRLMNLSLSGSPFSAPHHLDFMFLSCPKNQTSESGIIDCLSNATHVVLDTYNKLWADLMVSLYCQMIATAPIPTSRDIQPTRGYLVDLNEDIQLSWRDPDCKACERKSGICGFKNGTTQKISCSNSRPGNRIRHIAEIASLTITLPSFMCGIGIWCLRCHKNNRRRPSTSSRPMASPALSVPRPALPGFSASTALNRGNNNSSSSQQRIPLQPTADPSEWMVRSCTILELGYSRRITGPNNSVCPICLSEYLPKEILKRVLICNHCYHAECLDEWLQRKRLCPLCRNPVASSISPPVSP